MKRIFSAALLAFTIFSFAELISGCATTPRVDWNSRIGTYTYDQAVTDLGPPDKWSPLSDGGKVAEWIHREHSAASVGIGTGFFSPGMGVGVGESIGSGYREHVLKLVFGPDGKLVSWSKND